MKPIDKYGYAIFDKAGELAVFSHKMPIYWRMKPAREDCPLGYKVRKIELKEPGDGK